MRKKTTFQSVSLMIILLWFDIFVLNFLISLFESTLSTKISNGMLRYILFGILSTRKTHLNLTAFLKKLFEYLHLWWFLVCYVNRSTFGNIVPLPAKYFFPFTFSREKFILCVPGKQGVLYDLWLSGEVMTRIHTRGFGFTSCASAVMLHTHEHISRGLWSVMLCLWSFQI